MPRSRSSAFESITRSVSSWLARKVPLWRSRQSTSVVLPWSTCAMIATLRSGMLNSSRRADEALQVLGRVDAAHAARVARDVRDLLGVVLQHRPRAALRGRAPQQ